MQRLVCLLAVLGLASATTEECNELMDRVIYQVDDELRATWRDVIRVEDLNGEFLYRNEKGHCSCRGGYAMSLATLSRTGDVQIIIKGKAVGLRFALGLGQLDIAFSDCQLEIPRGSNVTEKAELSVDSNSLFAEITAVKNGTECVTTIDDIHMDYVGEMKLENGGSWLFEIKDSFLDLFDKHFRRSVVNVINSELRKAAMEMIPSFNLCDKIPPY